jgi:predicted RNA binding protein YcfA (HicA-like mRNA interferase family)
VVSGDRVVKALTRAGYVFRTQVGSHVTMKHPETGVKVAVPVHASRDMPVGTLRRIIRDAGLTVEEFRRLLK